MSQLQLLRALIRDRLIAAADEIFGAVERTIADYQEEVYSLQPTRNSQRQYLNVVVLPEMKFHLPEPQQHCEQERSPGLDQEDPEPTPIKEEHEEQQELCISQEKSFQGLEEEEDDDDDDDAKGSMLCVEPEDGEVQTSSNTNIFDDRLSTFEEKIQTHIDKRTLHCRVYEEDVEKNRNVEDHASISSEEYPYKCSECSKAFNNPDVLQLHLTIHRKKTPYNCAFCTKIFNSRSLLERHMRTHTGERPFRCNICPVSFSQKGHLNTHMRTHTGEKPFTCTDCGKGFTQSSNLRTHMKVHTAKKTCKRSRIRVKMFEMK